MRADELPTRQQISQLETNLKLPTNVPLDEYARYYWISPTGHPQSLRTCETDDLVSGGPFLRAVYIRAIRGFERYRRGVHTKRLPEESVCDGGCNVIDVAMDIRTGRIVEVACHAMG